MPEDVAIKGIKIIEKMLPREFQEGFFIWNWTGKKSI
jgi:hypothetical protein